MTRTALAHPALEHPALLRTSLPSRPHRTASDHRTGLVRTARVVAASLVLGAAALGGPPPVASTWLPAAPTAAAAQTSAKPLRVASYNIRCANCFDAQPDEKHWDQRRGAVVAAIKAQHPDVVGIQEASQGWLKVAGRSVDLSQFEDLQQRLGQPYALTDTSRNNCVRERTPTRCERKDQGASQGTRIIYNQDTLTKLSSGSKLLPSTNTTTNSRYVAWAVFAQRSTGKQFFFADAHLEPGNSSHVRSLRKKQAVALVAEVKKRNAQHLPTFVVGDFNSSRFTPGGNKPYDVLHAAGYRDPLGQAHRSTKTAPGAFVEHRVRTWVSSFNGFKRQAKRRKGWVNGSYIDYMMMTKMRVKEWETVARLSSKDRFKGTIPSDHNMIRATVYLP